MKNSSLKKFSFTRLLVFAFGGLIGSLTGYGGLSFEERVVEGVIPPGVEAFPFEFPFKNTGDSSVEIEKIKTSCGCTTAKLEKLVYAPGESGVIRGSFSVGSRQGLQRKKISVLTSDLGQREVKLALKLEIPSLVKMEPGLVLWRVGDAPEAKEIQIVPNEEIGVGIANASCEDDGFELILRRNSKSPSVTLEIKPTATARKSRALIRVDLELPEEGLESQTVFAHALIR